MQTARRRWEQAPINLIDRHIATPRSKTLGPKRKTNVISLDVAQLAVPVAKSRPEQVRAVPA